MFIPGSDGIAVSDPLAEWPRPTGSPAQLESAKGTLNKAAGKLEGTSTAMSGAVGSVVSGAWIGRASASCSDAVSAVATKYANAATYADAAKATLEECAARWNAALQKYDQARKWADEAMVDESQYKQRTCEEAAEYSANGDEGQAQARRHVADNYTSPLRMKAGWQARDATTEFEAATQQAVGKLNAAAHDLNAKGALTSPSEGEEVLKVGGVTAGAALGAHEWMLKPAAGQWHNNSKLVKEIANRHPLSKHLGLQTLDDLDPRITGKVGSVVKGLGAAGGVLAFGTGFAGQLMKDSRRYPDISADERATRAVVEGGSALGGSLAGGYVGAAIGTAICPVAGTVVGGFIGATVGGLLATEFNDGAVDLIGNKADEATDWVADTWDDVTPW